MIAIRFALLAALMLTAAPAMAERLLFDHRLSPPLKAVLDSKNAAMISFDDKNPRYVVDVIAVRGKSASDWSEALVIIARTPSRKVRTAAAWMAELRAEAESRCTNEIRTLAEDAGSVTFERRSTGCRGDYPPVAIYRAIAGERSLFLLAVMAKDDLSEQSQREWLSMLGSARLD